jgi:RNA polymerase sigma-70 factor (ECF subfamily)
LLFDSETVENLATAFADVSPQSIEPLDFLNECVDELNSKAKQLCDLRYEKDLKPAAIAEKLGMTANSVSKGLQRIRSSLKRCIEQKAIAGGAQ